MDEWMGLSGQHRERLGGREREVGMDERMRARLFFFSLFNL